MQPPSKVYRCEIEVRGYELDSYQHVNHAVYFNYLEHARWKMLEGEGMPLKQLDEWQRWPVVAGLEAKYIKPIFMGDRICVETQITSMRRVAFEIEHRILRLPPATSPAALTATSATTSAAASAAASKGEIVFTAKVSAVIVNERGRPADMPLEMMKAWEHIQ